MKIIIIAMVFIASCLPSAWAKDIAKPELALNEAIARALANSESVLNTDKEVSRTEELRKYSSEKLQYIPAGSMNNPEIEVAWSKLLSADITWRSSKKNLTAKQDSTALDACKKYWEVQKAIGAVNNAEVALKKADLDHAKAQASQKVGLLSKESLLGAETLQVKAKAALAKAKNDLDTAYTNFNQLVGLWPEDRPVLTEELTFAPLKVDNLDYEVARVNEESPTVWLAQEKVNLQKNLEDLMFYTGEYRPYEARKIEVDQAKLDAVSAEEAMELLTRSLYYSIKTIEQNYPAIEQAVKLAEEELRVAKLKQQMGMATSIDVAAAQSSLVQARQSQLELKENHAYLKLAFQKPWAYTNALGN